MDKATIILTTLVAYKVAMIIIGLWAASRNRSEADFFLGGRGLGPLVAGLSYAASTSSAWVILGFSGFVYAIGLSALWMVPGVWAAYAVVWLYFGGRLRQESRDHQQVTLTDFLLQDSQGDLRRIATVAAAVLVLFCFIFYVAAQLDAAGNALTENFAIATPTAIVIGATIVVFYSLVGGFWAVSVTDTVQAAIMMVVSVPVAAALFAFFLIRSINRHDPGTDRMQRIAGLIRSGAMAFLKTEYTVLAGFVAIMFVILVAFLPGNALLTAVAFLVGALLSASAGWIGMRTATSAAVRTTHAATTSLSSALRVAFSSGAVMGLTVVALGTLGISVLYMAYGGLAGAGASAVESLFGFSLGASSIALFARVGGGIFTKAADVAGDLSGKVEAGIPEDDPRNPATIADSVGDNVGDVAGMGADLFESYVGSIIASIALAWALTASKAAGDLGWVDECGVRRGAGETWRDVSGVPGRCRHHRLDARDVHGERTDDESKVGRTRCCGG